MMVIFAKVVRARKWYQCAQRLGECTGRIRPGQQHVVTYGAAELGDPPYRLRLCLACATHVGHVKILAALRATKEAEPAQEGADHA
jgi:hypothetical protein